MASPMASRIIQGVALGILSLMMACGDLSLDTNESLEIQMYGVAQQPTDATGSVSPTSETFVLAGVSLRSEDGSATTILYSGSDPVEAKIANRPQLIYSQDISSLAGINYSGIIISFSAAVKAESKNSSSHQLLLTETDYLHLEDFTVETGKSIVISVKVKWRNTVEGETLSAPELGFSLESS